MHYYVCFQVIMVMQLMVENAHPVIVITELKIATENRESVFVPQKVLLETSVKSAIQPIIIMPTLTTTNLVTVSSYAAL